MDVIHGNRRSGRRYELDLSLSYEVFEDGRRMRGGAGKTVDLGSGGLLVWTDQPLETGEAVRFSIDWLLPERDGTSVELAVTGEVVRSGPGFAAVRMHSWEFRRHQSVPLVRQMPVRRAPVSSHASALAALRLH